MSRPLPSQRPVASPPALPIPQYWTPEQALAVFDLLQSLREAVWNVYGAQIQQAWRDQLIHDGSPPEFDPDDPF